MTRMERNLDGSDAETELLALRLWLGLADTRDIDDWLDAYVARVPSPHPDALELFSLSAEQLTAAFMAFVRNEFDFEPNSARGSRVARELVARLCQSVLAGTLSVPNFCETVQRLDTTFNEPEAGLPYPKGLDDLWNGCDWCDETWSLENQPHLRELLENHVASAGDEHNE